MVRAIPQNLMPGQSGRISGDMSPISNLFATPAPASFDHDGAAQHPRITDVTDGSTDGMDISPLLVADKGRKSVSSVQIRGISDSDG